MNEDKKYWWFWQSDFVKLWYIWCPPDDIDNDKVYRKSDDVFFLKVCKWLKILEQKVAWSLLAELYR